MAKKKKNKLSGQKHILSDAHRLKQESAQTVAPHIEIIDSVESIYKSLNGRHPIKSKASLMLLLRSWLTEVSTFDPVSGHVLHTGTNEILAVASRSLQEISLGREIKDRIHRIISHTNEAILTIMNRTRVKILREHAMLPIYSAREVDSSCVQWLSHQPGRTLREKLASKPYIKAVRRRTSIDTTENRLLKAFLFRMEQILIERQNVLSASTEETCEELLVNIQRWFRNEDTSEIGDWGNLPPNNTLLQDKYYRKIWDGWIWLRNLDEQIKMDFDRSHRDVLCVIFWNVLSLLYDSGRFRIVQQPVKFDYDNFSISPEQPIHGYLFPVESKIKGKIKFISLDKSYGFITSFNGKELYFNTHNLSPKLSINSLNAGDEVYFVIGSNIKGECADNITLPEKIIPVKFNMTDDTLHLQIDDNIYLIQLIYDNLNIEKLHGAKIQLKIDHSTLKEIPKRILSIITNSSFEYYVQTNNQIEPIILSSTVVDLCSIRPIFTNNTGSQAVLPFRLLRQHWKLNEYEDLPIDCGLARSIAMNPDIVTISMRSLFLNRSTISDAIKNSSAMFFIEKLSEYLKTDKLTYLVPDWGNDFALERIRKSVNFYFNESVPLPKSIATIIAWQSSKKFVQDKVQENDFVLVVDSFDDGISITPVQARYEKELHKLLPETQGLFWERHPTFIQPNNTINTTLIDNLSSTGCKDSANIVHLFGFDGLVSDSGKVSFVKGEHWYHLPCFIHDALVKDLDLNVVINNAINNCVKSTYMPYKADNIFILPLQDTIKKPNEDLSYKWLGSAWSPIKGCQTLNSWQQHIGDISIWRDLLPELSIRIVRNGHYDNFYLVKNATITPQRGKRVNIPVNECFTLPSGQKHYSFPLQEGDDNKILQFIAFLKSPAFPLKRDTVCQLKMTYTYGANDAYDLKFIPIDASEAGFKSIQVEWRPASDCGISYSDDMPIPDFPTRKNWSDFQKFPPKEDGKNCSDLLDWCSTTLAKLDDIISFNHDYKVQSILNDRKEGFIECKKTDKNGKYFYYVKVNGERVFCHIDQFVDDLCENTPQLGAQVYLDVNKGDKGPYGLNISADKLPPKLIEKVHLEFSNLMKRVEKYMNKLHFPALTIWNHEHSLSEPDVPETFKNTIFDAKENIKKILNLETISDSLKDELFFFLSLLHKDAPDIVGLKLLEYVNDQEQLKKYYKYIAFYIGSAEQSYQKELLEKVIRHAVANTSKMLVPSISLVILSIALWRSETLINKLNKEELCLLSKNLHKCIELDVKITRDAKPNQIKTLTSHLELLLALLRSRGMDNKEIQTIYAPDKDRTKKFATLIDEVCKFVLDKNFEIKSRISLQIEKPETFDRTPDLLYALRMYLTGDTGANAISISKVNDE